MLLTTEVTVSQSERPLLILPIISSHIIINNYSPKWRWLAVDIYRAAEI